MSLERILVPTDLTSAASKAVEFAIMLARKGGTGLTLLHVNDDPLESFEQVEAKLREIAAGISGNANIDCNFILKKGKNIFNVIPDVACEECFRMMVIGTHGIRGLRQKLVGADILRLIKQVPIPVLVVQKESRLPVGGFKKILLPVGGHLTYGHLVDATVYTANLFDSDVQVYSIEKPGFEYTDQLKKNLEATKASFEKNMVHYKRVIEPQSVYSVGYAKQTIQYAQNAGTDLIAIMSVPTEEFYFFADSDKESLLTNPMNIPVLCASSAEKGEG